MEAVETQPLVAVMMPVYNGAETIEIAIASLIMQTYTNWVCYIVNDGSTDGTKAILDRLTDPRLKIIHFEQNKGRPYARQAALDAAEGEFLAFLDADDIFHPRKLEIQLEAFASNPNVDLVSCGMGSYDGNNQLLKVRGTNPAKANRELKVEVPGVFDAPHAASMTRLNLSKKVKYNMALKFAQDTDFFLRYLENRKYIICSEVLYYYSEFVSVTGKKILKTYWIIIKKNVNLLGKKPLVASKTIIKTASKSAIMSLMLPFVGAEYFLNKRGRAASDKEIAEFDKVKTQLGL